MIDHVFTNLITALQQSLETSMLEPLPNEEHMLLDVFLGDIRFESSYALPGETEPANIRVDISLEWLVWSQGIYRSWLSGEGEADTIEVGIEITIRATCLMEPPNMTEIGAVLDESSPTSLQILLERSSLVKSESVLGSEFGNEFEIEVAYDGAMVLDETALQNPLEMTHQFDPLGPWLASMLVRLSDQPLKFYPSQESDL